MAELIDPDAVPGDERSKLPAPRSKLSASLWEGDTEIPRKLSVFTPQTSSRGWLITAVATGSACLVLAVGGTIAWQSPALQSAPQPQSVEAAPPVERKIATTTLPVGKPASDLRPQVTSERGASQSRQSTFAPRLAAQSELPPNDSPTPEDEVSLSSSQPQFEPAADAPRPPSAYLWSINRVRAALVSRDLKRAQLHLQLAGDLASSPSQKAQLVQFRALGNQLDRFWGAVRDGLADLEPAEELHIGGAIAAVVEIGPDSLSLFVTGARRDYTLANLPTKVALFVVGRVANENAPAYQVFCGAFHAVDLRGDRDQARQLWQSAAAAGESVDGLLPFLESNALLIEREPPPEAARLELVERAVEQKFAVAIEAAKSAERNSQLAARLIAAAADAENAPEQYALLKQAARFAIAGAEPQAALRAIDERARWFEVDAWTLKAETLAEAQAVSASPASAKRIAASALELSLAAQADHLRQPAQSLAVTAASAAHKAHDRELIQKTARHLRDFEADTSSSASE